MAVVVGVDIAKRSFDLAVLQPNGKHRTKGKLRKLRFFSHLIR